MILASSVDVFYCFKLKLMKMWKDGCPTPRGCLTIVHTSQGRAEIYKSKRNDTCIASAEAE